MMNNNNSFPLYQPQGYFFCPPNSYRYAASPQNPFLRYAQYTNVQPNPFFFRSQNTCRPVQPSSVPYRLPIKSAQSDAIIVIDDECQERPSTGQAKIVPLPEAKEAVPRRRQTKMKTLTMTSEEYQYLERKVCERCRKVESDDKLLLCDYCDDAFHSYCLDSVLVDLPGEEDIWACPLCASELETIKKNEEQTQAADSSKKSNSCLLVVDPRYRNLWMRSQIGRNFQGEIKPEFQDISGFQINFEVCAGCRTLFSQEKQERCFICKKSFHSHCLNPNNQSQGIICFICDQNIKNSIPENFCDFFKELSHMQIEPVLSESSRPRKKKKSYIYKTAKIFRLPVFASSQLLREQKRNLYYYLKARGTEFCDDLVYDGEKCSSTQNFANLEPQLKELKKANIEVINKFKELSRQGNYSPVLIEEDKQQGFIVRAYENIPKRTLICEYAGEVDFARNKIFEKNNDSIMMLLRTTRSKTSLVICPKRYANIAKFISGINNFDPGAKEKQNVNSVRFSINNQARVFLYARRKINAGEVLYYDYNAGGLNEYPTLGFV